MKLYLFRLVPLSIIRSFSLYAQQCYTCMSYRFADSLRAESGCSVLILLASCQQTCMTNNIAVCVQWKTPDDGQRNYPKHVEFHSKNKFEKLVHLVGFIIRNLTRCTVTWTSNLFFVCSAPRIFCVQCGRTFRKAIFFITASNANAQSSFIKMNLQGKKISGCRNVPGHGRVSRDRSKPTSDRSTVVMGRRWSTSLYDAVQLLPAVLMRD